MGDGDEKGERAADKGEESAGHDRGKMRGMVRETILQE
jgi:hypothetical protein